MLQRSVLESLAARIGFDAVGVAPVGLLTGEVDRLRQWVAEGENAGMDYMGKNFDLREDPALLVEGARSVIVTLTNYYTAAVQQAGQPRIARYARGKDYHLVVKERLYTLLEQLCLNDSVPVQGRCFVDSAPVLEHEWARRAGLGWQGKNTLLIRRGLGSYTFIGVIISTAVFDTYDEPFTDSWCGTCHRCVDACPTGALMPHEVDARKCISYLTIENKGEYPGELKKLAGGRIFGCDACQDVCPWNRRAQEHCIPAFISRPEIAALTEEDWQLMDNKRFKQLFKDTPLERTGLLRIRRNL